MSGSAGSERVHASVAAGVALILLAAACGGGDAVDNAGITHANGTRISPDRPECPQVWDSIPLFDTREGSAPKFGRPATGADTGGANGASIAAGWVGARALGASGPITNIPEFHDCQMFITADGRNYDGLYAIFASFKLDTVVKDLKIDTLFWVSSSPAVATVSAAGVVTGVTPGNVTITGTSTVDTARSAAFVVTVIGGPPGPDSTVFVGPGLPAPPPIAVGRSVTFAMTLAPPTKTSFPVGEVYAYTAGYPALGIAPNFNCLYIYFDIGGVLRAKMVPVANPGPNADACFSAVDPNAPGGIPLQIVRHLVTNEDDVPQAARWDYDDANKQQYIGIKCGSAWCEIGAAGFVSSGGYLAAPSAPPGEARVIGNKGWYDQQYLSMYDATTGRLVPTRIKGTVFPSPEPTPRTLAAYHTFVPIAYSARIFIVEKSVAGAGRKPYFARYDCTA